MKHSVGAFVPEESKKKEKIKKKIKEILSNSLDFIHIVPLLHFSHIGKTVGMKAVQCSHEGEIKRIDK